MRIINVDPIMLLLGIIALCTKQVFPAIALLYMAFAIPTQIVNETKNQMLGGINLIGNEAKNVNKNKN